MNGKQTISCSFCGRDKKEALLLIAGLSAHICEVCVDEAHGIVGEELYDSGYVDTNKATIDKLESKIEALNKELELSKGQKEHDSNVEEAKVFLREGLSIGKSDIAAFVSHFEHILTKKEKGEIQLSEILNYIDTIKKRERKYLADMCIDKVSNAEIKEAIKLLLQYAQEQGDAELRKEIIQISSKWNSLAREIRKGVVKPDDANVEQNKISVALIDIIEGLEEA